MENRYKLPKAIQQKYLLQVEKTSGLSGDKLANLFGVVGRTYRDWKRGKYSITEKTINIIENKYHIDLPYSKKKALSSWKKSKLASARRGGMVVIAKYGSPGTPEGRSLGGRRAIAILRAKGLVPQPKPFLEPNGYSIKLAEFIGILLGDGHIGKGQWSITLNSIVDELYIGYVFTLIKNLFGFEPGKTKRKNMNAVVIYGSGIYSIKYFQKLGLKIGNKIKQQVGVPNWITQNKEYRKACLRGLMDTDGGIFIHKYKVNGKEYRYIKLCFVNRSMPLLDFVYDTLIMSKFHPKKVTKVENKRVWLYNQKEVIEYLKIIGASNPRLYKFQGGLPEW